MCICSCFVLIGENGGESRKMRSWSIFVPRKGRKTRISGVRVQRRRRGVGPKLVSEIFISEGIGLKLVDEILIFT